MPKPPELSVPKELPRYVDVTLEPLATVQDAPSFLSPLSSRSASRSLGLSVGAKALRSLGAPAVLAEVLPATESSPKLAERLAIASGAQTNLKPGAAQTKEDILHSCLMLDDIAFGWLSQQLLLARRGFFQVPENVAVASPVSTSKPIPPDLSVLQSLDNLAGDESKAELEMVAKQAKPAFLKSVSVIADPGDLDLGDPADLDDAEVNEDDFADPDGEMVDKAPIFRAMNSIYEKDFYAGNSDFYASTSEATKDFGSKIQSTIRERDLKLHGPDPSNLKPSISFEAPIIYCEEAQAQARVAILRIGDSSFTSSVAVTTRDISAKAHVKYIPHSEILVFRPGEWRKEIVIDIINDDKWDCTLEFEVVLSNEGIQNAMLATYAHSMRVKIIDGDAFPTQKFRQQLLDMKEDEIKKPLLLLEYFKMNFTNPIVRVGTIKILLVDMIGNLRFVVDLFLDMYIVDYVLCPSCNPDMALFNLLLISILKVGFFPLEHYLEYRKNFWKVGGTSRMTLQANLLRKYLSYDEQSLSEINASKLTLALTRDCTMMVQKGFGQIPKFANDLSRLVLIIFYQTFTPLALGKELTLANVLQRIIPVIFFPIVMACFLLFRNRTVLSTLHAVHNSQNAMLHQVRQTVLNNRLIQDYKKRGVFVDRFVETIKQYNGALVAAQAVSTNNTLFAEWCVLSVLVIYIPVVGMMVVDDRLALGTFLNNIAIIKALGRMCTQMYEVVLTMQSTFQSLSTVTHFMNLPTDSLHRSKQNQQNLKQARAAMKQLDGACCPADLLCIEMRSLHFRYNPKGHIGIALSPSSMMLPQGGFYTLVGPPSEGKGTILKLLGEVLIPYFPGFERNVADGSGELLIPPHVRALHVSKDPMFTQDTLLENLTFGCIKDTGDDSVERVLAICTKLGVPNHLLRTINESKLRCKWLEMLSSTESALLHIARALVANPEILIIHKPALFLNTEMSDIMYTVLKEYVSNRGLCVSNSSYHERRPRTCIISARRVQGAGAAVADAVFTVSLKTGLRRLNTDEETENNKG